jgi:transposase-like protein
MFSLKDLNELLEKIPIWKKLIQLPEKLDSIEKRIKSIEDKMSSTGELCPYCKQPSLKLLEIKPHEMLGDVGLKVGYYKCDNCKKDYERELKDW